MQSMTYPRAIKPKNEKDIWIDSRSKEPKLKE
jgi:hypothetical protein